MGYTQYIGGTKTSFEIDRVTRPAQYTLVPIQDQVGTPDEDSDSYECKSGEVIDSFKTVGNDATDVDIEYWLYGEDTSTTGHEFTIEDSDTMFGPFIKVEVTSDDGAGSPTGHKGVCYVKRGGA